MHSDQGSDIGQTFQQTPNICITFIQCWSNVEAVGPTLLCKCFVFAGIWGPIHTNVIEYEYLVKSYIRIYEYEYSILRTHFNTKESVDFLEYEYIDLLFYQTT